MFSDKKAQNTQPSGGVHSDPKSGNPNPNTGAKGNYTGVSKKHQQTITKKKTSAIASSGAFGKARDMGGGRHNFSKGAPGHQTGGK